MSARMPFGRYKGVLIADLDDGYLTWLHDHVDLREPLKSAIQAEYALRFSSHHKSGKARPLDAEMRQMATEIVSAGYRKLAMEHHPDHGGETRTMQLVNRAADFLRQAVRGNT